MKRIIAVIAILLIVLFGGCQMKKDVKPSEMSPNDLPDERAFQDEFTREFLQSAEETRPGYYPFLSKTGKYAMDFPGGGVINKPSYSLRKNNFEFIDTWISRSNDNGASLSIMYYGSHDAKQIEDHLDWFKDRLGSNVEFEEHAYKNKNKITYFSNFIDKDFNHMVAFLQNTEKPGGIELIYTVDCLLDNQCKEDENLNKEIFLDWINSIEFIND